MKRIIIYLSLAISLCACYKHSINGDLDGQWQVMEVEHLSDGNVSTPALTYYCFFLHTVNLTSVYQGECSGNMGYHGKRLELDFPYVTNPKSLNRWGMYDTRTVFTVESINSDNLVLKSDSAEIRLRKF